MAEFIHVVLKVEHFYHDALFLKLFQLLQEIFVNNVYAETSSI